MRYSGLSDIAGFCSINIDVKNPSDYESCAILPDNIARDFNDEQELIMENILIFSGYSIFW